MERHDLELSNGHEHKFYEVTIEGASLTVRYGRIGTDGQIQHKTCATPGTARREADQKLAEKRRKGYADAVIGERDKRAVTLPRLKLPEVLKPYRDRIEATLRPFVSLGRAGGEVFPWSSKLGGASYREAGQAWPTASDGRAPVFLAQLNFAELPPLDGFPTQGIAQFFILDDDLFGCGPEQGVPLDEVRQDTYRVLYHPEVTRDMARLDPRVPAHEVDNLPHDPRREVVLRGVFTEEPMTWEDRLFDEVVRVDLLDETETPDGELLGKCEARRTTRSRPPYTSWVGTRTSRSKTRAGPRTPICCCSSWAATRRWE